MNRMDPAMMSADRFWSKVDRESGPCWIWTAAKNGSGYGNYSIKHRFVAAHRYAYTVTNGPIPDGMTVDHTCFRPLCVNPDHLRLLTHSDNAANQRSALAESCVRGHLFTPENTYMGPGGRGPRNCRACGRERSRAYKARKAALIEVAS